MNYRIEIDTLGRRATQISHTPPDPDGELDNSQANIAHLGGGDQLDP